MGREEGPVEEEVLGGVACGGGGATGEERIEVCSFNSSHILKSSWRETNSNWMQLLQLQQLQ